MTEEASEPIQIGKLIENIRQVLSFLFSLGTLVAITGFVVVHAHLTFYTKIPLLSISPVHYFVAGFLMLGMFLMLTLIIWFVMRVIFIFLDVLDKIFSNILSWRFQASIYLIIFIICIYLLIRASFTDVLTATIVSGLTLFLVSLFISDIYKKDGKRDWNSILEISDDPSKVIRDLFKRPNIFVWLYIMFFAICFTIILGLVSGVPGYNSIYATVGGGKPSPISLIFDKPDDIELFSLPSVTEHETTPLCLVIETGSDYLIYIPQTQNSVLVPKDRVAAIRDTRESVDCSPPIG